MTNDMPEEIFVTGERVFVRPNGEAVKYTRADLAARPVEVADAKLTKKQAAIISVYTGFLVGTFSGMHEYAEEKLGRPIWTHQFPDVADELREKSKQDFISLSPTA